MWKVAHIFLPRFHFYFLGSLLFQLISCLYHILTSWFTTARKHVRSRVLAQQCSENTQFLTAKCVLPFTMESWKPCKHGATIILRHTYLDNPTQII